MSSPEASTIYGYRVALNACRTFDPTVYLVLLESTFQEHDITSWTALERVEIRHMDVILGHNVEYTGSMSRVPILVLNKERVAC